MSNNALHIIFYNVLAVTVMSPAPQIPDMTTDRGSGCFGAWGGKCTPQHASRSWSSACSSWDVSWCVLHLPFCLHSWVLQRKPDMQERKHITHGSSWYGIRWFLRSSPCVFMPHCQHQALWGDVTTACHIQQHGLAVRNLQSAGKRSCPAVWMCPWFSLATNRLATPMRVLILLFAFILSWLHCTTRLNIINVSCNCTNTSAHTLEVYYLAMLTCCAKEWLCCCILPFLARNFSRAVQWTLRQALVECFTPVPIYVR